MNWRVWTWIGVVVVVAILIWQGIAHWNHLRELEAKAELATEIRTELAKRPTPERRGATAEERETAALYLRALSFLATDNFADGFHDSMDGVPWASTPEITTQTLVVNGPALRILDEATARGVCRISQEALRNRTGQDCVEFLHLLAARGHAALAEGRTDAAIADVRRLVHLGQVLASDPVSGEAENAFPMGQYMLRTAEKKAADLLTAVVRVVDLPVDRGPLLVAAAEARWNIASAIQESMQVHAISTDSMVLRLLRPDAVEYLRDMNEKLEELGNYLNPKPPPPKKNVISRALDHIRGEAKKEVIVGTAAEWRVFRTSRAEILAAIDRRDAVALAPGASLNLVPGAEAIPNARWFRRSVEDEARIAVARTAAAIRAFQLAEGRPPRALSDLVPSIVPEIPPDPFDGKSLQYQVDGNSWRLASRNWSEFGTPEEGNDMDLEVFEVVSPPIPK